MHELIFGKANVVDTRNNPIFNKSIIRIMSYYVYHTSKNINWCSNVVFFKQKELSLRALKILLYIVSISSEKRILKYI